MISKQEHNNILLEFRVQNKQLLREVERLREVLKEILKSHDISPWGYREIARKGMEGTQ